MQAPNFTLQDIHSDQNISLADFKGKKVMLTFWTSWCPDCQRDLPQKAAFYATLPKDSDLVFLTINVTGREATQSDGIAYYKKMGWTFPVLLDEHTKVYDAYRCQSVPTTVLLNEKHEIAALFNDQASFLDVLSALSKLL